MRAASVLAGTTFALGWIAFAASTLRAGVLRRRGPTLVIAGLFLTPLLGAVLSPAWGPALGNAVLGSGWFLLGSELFRTGAERPLPGTP